MNEFNVTELFVVPELGIVFAGRSLFFGTIPKTNATLIVDGCSSITIELDGECLLSPRNLGLRAVSTKTPINIAHDKLGSGICKIQWS